MSQTDIPPPPVPTQLIVFADDWGRHPSSSQHLIRELLPQYPTLWVNTVGTRRPRLSTKDFSRGLDVLRGWFVNSGDQGPAPWPEGLQVIAPFMYPGYRRRWQRRLNASRVRNEVKRHLRPDHRRVVVSTLPTTSDLVGQLSADRWIYYCVDDYSQWPGTDHATMDKMERELVAKVHAIACVSETLQERAQSMGAEQGGLLTHGVDLERWATPDPMTRLITKWPDERKPIALFWGLIDSRMDVDWCTALGDSEALHVVYAGPFAENDKPLLDADAVYTGPIPFQDLPAHAAASNVLIMPYIDAPVTRAMQPLKLKEYLATMKPVVVRDLPSTRQWADCCDLATSAGGFVDLVKRRAETGILPEQLDARKRRLPGESWTTKAAQLAEIINGG